MSEEMKMSEAFNLPLKVLEPITNSAGGWPIISASVEGELVRGHMATLTISQGPYSGTNKYLDVELAKKMANGAAYSINNHDRLTSDLSATQELLRLKELECEQLAEDKAELVGHLRDVTMIASHCHAVGVRLQPFQRAEIDDAKQLLERLG